MVLHPCLHAEGRGITGVGLYGMWERHDPVRCSRLCIHRSLHCKARPVLAGVRGK